MPSIMLPILGKEFQGVQRTGRGPMVPNFPDKFLPQLIHTLQVFPNDTTDFTQPHIRTSLQNSYPYFITVYVVVILLGIAANVVMLIKILNIARHLREKKTNFTDYLFLANVAILNILMCAFVMPLSLAIVLIQNWVFGRVLCYLAPVMQDVPLYGGLMSLLGTAVCRFIGSYTSKCPLEGCKLPKVPLEPPSTRGRQAVGKKVAVVASTWLGVGLAVAPQVSYIHFYDLQASLGSQFRDVGLCTVDTSAGIVLYNRALFVGLYLLPLLVCCIIQRKTFPRLHARVVAPDHRASYRQRASCDVWSSGNSGRTLKSPMSLVASQQQQQQPLPNTDDEPQYDNIGEGYLNKSPSLPRRVSADMTSSHRDKMDALNDNCSSEFEGSLMTDEDRQINVMRKRDLTQMKFQRYFAGITMFYGLCLCPLMVLRLVRNLNRDDVITDDQLDSIIVTVVLIAILQTVSTPVLLLLAIRTLSPDDLVRHHPSISASRRESHVCLAHTASLQPLQSSPTGVIHCPSHSPNVHYSMSSRHRSSITSGMHFDTERGPTVYSAHKIPSRGGTSSKRPSLSHSHTAVLSPRPQHHPHPIVYRQHSYDPPRSPIHLTLTQNARNSIVSLSHLNLQQSVSVGAPPPLRSPCGSSPPMRRMPCLNSVTQGSLKSSLLPHNTLTHLSPLPPGRRVQRHGSCIESTGFTHQQVHRLSVGRI